MIGAGAVAHQHVVGDPDRNLFGVHRIDRIGADEDARFFFGQIGALEIGFRRDGDAIFFHGRFPIGCGQSIDQRVFG